MDYKRVVVICVDRDADIQTKVGEGGPIYGRENVLSAAQRLGLADPLETDTNALYEAVRLYDDYKKQGAEAEVVAVVGSPELGLESDTRLSKQLDEALSKIGADGAVVVSDGAEDEYILPLVQSRIKIISVRRVVVKQSEKLESTYYVLQDFLKEVVNDPKLSRFYIGLPGIALLLYMVFGAHGWRIIFGIIGVFLVIKGFGMENAVERVFGEFKSSFVTGKISFLTYLVAVLIALVGVVVGYDQLNRLGIPFSSLSESVPIFLSESLDLFTFAVIVALIGKSIDAFLEKKSLWKYVLFGVLVISIRIIIESISMFLLGQINYFNLALWVILGLILSMLAFISMRATWKARKMKKGAN